MINKFHLLIIPHINALNFLQNIKIYCCLIIFKDLWKLNTNFI